MQNDKVPLIIGTVSSGNVLAFAPIMQKAGVPLDCGPFDRHQHYLPVH